MELVRVTYLGALQIKNKTRYYGSGWVGPDLLDQNIGKSAENSPMLVLIFWGGIYNHVYFVCIHY